jgi:hypothetical protein
MTKQQNKIEVVKNDFKADIPEGGVDTMTTQLVPGYSDEKMLMASQIRGSSGGRYYATATSVSATGNKTITGCPFTPTYARCTATRGYNPPSISIGAGTANPGSMIAIASGVSESSNSYFVIVRDTGGTAVSRATLSSFTSDGCVINFSVQSGTTELLVELFG